MRSRLWAGGPEGWRWAWIVLGIPVSIVGVAAFFMREPPRGQFEKQDVLGEQIADDNPAPISMEAAFARLKRIRTLRTVLVGFCALGFGLFSQGSLASLYLDDTLHVDSVLRRGVILSLSGIIALPLLPLLGSYFDRVYRQNPAKALALVGLLILPSGLFTPLRFSTHSEALFVLFDIPQAVLTTCAFAMVGPVLWAVVPYRLRGMGTALSTMYIFFIGGFLGGLIAGFLTDAISVRGAVIILAVPTALIGGLLLMNGARYIRNDLSLVVEELLEEQEEFHKRTTQGAATPALQVANLDFSYGPGAGAVRRQLRGPTGRDRRAARNQRRGQVDRAAGDQRTRGARARRRATRRTQHHVRVARGARPARSGSCSSPAARACSPASPSTRTWP